MATSIFLASSSELENDRKEFRLFINEKNSDWEGRGISLKTILWEEFLDAFSSTRSQDEYNKAIEECDLFVLLFFTKVGQFTEEEFDKAYEHFKVKGKPLLFTYFKNAEVKTGSISREMLSLLNFKDKLSKLEHFYAVYETVGDLKYDFSSQLDKLAAKGFFSGNAGSAEKRVSTNGNHLPKELTLALPKTDPREIIGREEDLEDLHRHLSYEQRVVVVNGLGGVGKTTLAQAYVSRFYNEYRHIAWISQISKNPDADFINTAGLAENLGIEKVGSQPDQLFTEMIRRLKAINESPNLLIIDNAEQSLRQYRDIMPGQPLWHLLVTSRETIDGFYKKPLDFLGEEEAIALFKKYYTRKKLTDGDIKEVVQAVDYHTLTIEILSKTAEVQRSDLTTLKAAIQNDLRANVPVARQKEPVERIGSYLATVFSCSQLSEREVWLMKQLVCLPPEYHPYDLLTELTVEENSPYKESFSETLEGLVKRGWLLYNSEAESYKMHRIIADVMKKQHPLSPADVTSLISAVTQKLKVDQTKDNPVEKFVWVPFGKAVLAHFPENTTNEISVLQNNLATVLQDLGDYTGAKVLLEKALKSAEKNFGEEHPTTAVSYSNLATVLKVLGDYTGAKGLLEKALKSDEKNFGEEHPTTAVRYSNLALVLQDLGDYTGAKGLLEKALKSDEKNFGEEHPTTATRYSNLALVLKNLGDYTGAKGLLEKALKSAEKNFGEEHPTTAVSYSNLALVLQDLGDYTGAKGLLEKALKSDEKNFGEEHPTTAVSYSNLALVLKNLGDYTGAKGLLEKALKSDEKNFGEEHPTTAVRYWNLAALLSNLGEYQQAFAFIQKARGIYTRVLPEGHPYLARVTGWYNSIKEKLDNLSSGQ